MNEVTPAERATEEVAYVENLAEQEAVYWEARRQGMGLTDKQVGDLLRVAARARAALADIEGTADEPSDGRGLSGSRLP